jgi:hypothetical protein
VVYAHASVSHLYWFQHETIWSRYLVLALALLPWESLARNALSEPPEDKDKNTEAQDIQQPLSFLTSQTETYLVLQATSV